MNTPAPDAPMTSAAWLAECTQRIAISEGCSLSMYHDTMGVPTIAFGFNLRRPEAQTCLRACGVINPGEVIAGRAEITQLQAQTLLEQDIPTYVDDARRSLNDGVFDALADARRFVIVDLVYNLGPSGWQTFTQTRELINAAATAKGPEDKHVLFSHAADHLAASLWATQVGDRAKRDIAMMRSSTWVDPHGDGSA